MRRKIFFWQTHITALHETKRFILGNFSFTIKKRFVSYYEMKRLLSVNETFLSYKRFVIRLKEADALFGAAKFFVFAEIAQLFKVGAPAGQHFIHGDFAHDVVNLSATQIVVLGKCRQVAF